MREEWSLIGEGGQEGRRGMLKRRVCSAGGLRQIGGEVAKRLKCGCFSTATRGTSPITVFG